MKMKKMFTEVVPNKDRGGQAESAAVERRSSIKCPLHRSSYDFLTDKMGELDYTKLQTRSLVSILGMRNHHSKLKMTKQSSKVQSCAPASPSNALAQSIISASVVSNKNLIPKIKQRGRQKLDLHYKPSTNLNTKSQHLPTGAEEEHAEVNYLSNSVYTGQYSQIHIK